MMCGQIKGIAGRLYAIYTSQEVGIYIYKLLWLTFT